MNESNSSDEEELCDDVLSNTWLYPIIAWFVFTFLLSAFSLLYAAIEAKKKHTEIEEAYEDNESDEDEYFTDEEGSDLSSLYETMPEEYRIKSSQNRRSKGNSLVNNLDQIIEDEDEDAENEDEESAGDDKVENSEQSSDDSEVEVVTSRFTKYRGSLAGKETNGTNSSDESEVDPDKLCFSKY